MMRSYPVVNENYIGYDDVMSNPSTRDAVQAMVRTLTIRFAFMIGCATVFLASMIIAANH